MQYKDKLLQDIAEKQQQDLPNYRQKRPSFVKKTLKLLGLFVIIIISLFTFFYVRSAANENGKLTWINNIPIIGHIKSLAESTNVPLAGEDRGRINVLLLGIGGENHEGAYLTDTIIIASFDVKTNKVAMLSIPRDMVIPVTGMGWPKINHVNSYAETRDPGSGGRVTSEVVSQVLDAPIDYYITIDFEGFTRVIDKLGGVKVYVDQTFDDYHYPINGEEKNPDWDARFEHLHFDEGLQKMDGNLALKYARSRYAGGIEGTDFARAARQQKVIQAVKEKMLSKSTLLNPRLVSSLINQIQENIDTDMKIWEIVRLWNLFKDIEQKDIINKVLSNRPSGLLADSMSEDGAYTLIPRAGNFTEVQYLFDNMFFQIPEKDKLKITEENTKLQILNGTFIAGLAGKTAVDLENYGFKIIQTANASQQDFESSVIYDLTFGEKEDSIKILREQTGANISTALPDWLKEDIATAVNNGDILIQPDLILILGESADLRPSLSTENVNI